MLNQVGRGSKRTFYFFTSLCVLILCLTGFIFISSTKKPLTVIGQYSQEENKEILDGLDRDMDSRVSPHNFESTRIKDKTIKDGDKTQSQNVNEYGGEFVATSYKGEMSIVRANKDEFDRTILVNEKTDVVWFPSSKVIEHIESQPNRSDRNWTFGWLLLDKSSSPDELNQVFQSPDIEFLSTEGELRRIKFSASEQQLLKIASIPGVAGIGITDTDRKMTTDFETISKSLDPEPIPVFITLMTDDPSGQWRKTLEETGVEIRRYDSDLRVYVGRVEAEMITRISKFDFVLRVEPVRNVQKQHDTAIPAMGVDVVRSIGRNSGEFSGIGGESVPIGVVDTGLNLAHVDISTHRESICGANFQWLGTSPDEDLWIDYDGHGTHVTGTIAGKGLADARFVGFAPQIQHIRFAKVLSLIGADEEDVIQGMDYLAKATGCEDSEHVLPRIVNLSLGGSSKFFEGRETSARKTDAIVWDKRQLYVVAQSNDGSDGLSQFATAKNSLAVGAALDSGEIAYFSSHGPTADGRLAPNIVATGVDVCSAKGDGSIAGYVCYSGTSMAAPSVAGVAALLLDAQPSYGMNPALTRAMLMASAIRPEPWFDNSDRFPRHNSNGPGTIQHRFGMGKVSAITAITSQSSSRGWQTGSASATLTTEGDIAYYDVDVPAGAHRLDVVMTWDEAPADVVLAPVLNDLDLWIDYLGDCGTKACGENSSVSRVDNVEWAVIQNPRPGKYRIKVVAQRIYSVAPRVGVAWVVINGSDSPQLNLDLEVASSNTISDGRLTELNLLVSASDYVAAGSRLHFSCSSAQSGCDGVQIGGVQIDRLDGIRVDSSTHKRWEIYEELPIPIDAKLPIGDIPVGKPREVLLKIHHPSSASFRLFVTASAWNGIGQSKAIDVEASSYDYVSSGATALSNDRFDDATLLEGKDGNTQIRIHGSTTESGEPGYRGPCLNNDCFSRSYRGCSLYRDYDNYERPAHSVWFEWTAPANEVVRLWVTGTDEDSTANLGFTAYEGDQMASLKQIAANHWEEPDVIARCVYFAGRYYSDQLSFIANRGTKYRFRFESSTPPQNLKLHWSQGRPVNDDFAMARKLSDDEGEFVDRNAGATTQSDEAFGSLAASVWYSWTAPRDGVWEFEVDSEDLRVAVFKGSNLANARLLTRFPDTEAKLKVKRGLEYRILVAAAHGATHPRTFKLSWEEPWFSYFLGNDLFTDAEQIEIGEDLYAGLLRATVEPDEPLSTGIRTDWWRWTAPESAVYTLKNRDEDIDLVANVFEGSDISNLNLVASNADNRTLGELAFEASSGTSYFISLGWPMGDNRAFLSEYGSSSFWEFGITPINDEPEGAIPLLGLNGETTAFAKYATTGDGELKDRLGRWSLWWQFEVSESDWFRFYTPDSFLSPDIAFAVYDEVDLDTPIAISGWLEDEIGVTFFAESGRKYVIRTGIQGYQWESEYTLQWESTTPPTWLRYIGAQSFQIDQFGNRRLIEHPSKMAVDPSNKILFATTPIGIATFEISDKNGSLSPITTIDIGDESNELILDAENNRMIVNQCDRWYQITISSSTNGVVFDNSMLSTHGVSADCASQLLSVNQSLYRVIPNLRIENLTFDNDGGVNFVDEISISGVSNLVAHSDGSQLFANGRRLTALSRNDQTGTLQASDSSYYGGIGSIAFSDDQRYLLQLNDSIFPRLLVFTIADGISSYTDYISLSWYQFSRLSRAIDRKWTSLFPRIQQGAVDLLGTNSAISISWDSKELQISEELGDGSDRFRNFVPLFGNVRHAVLAVNGKYIYLGTDEDGILIMQRLPAFVAE